MARIKELESHSESNQLDELQRQRDDLVNRNSELNGKLIRYAGEIETLSDENRTLKNRTSIFLLFTKEHKMKRSQQGVQEIFGIRNFLKSQVLMITRFK